MYDYDGDEGHFDDDGDDIRAKAEARVQKREAVRRNVVRFFVIDGLIWVALGIATFGHINTSLVNTFAYGLLFVSLLVGAYVVARWYAVTRLAPAREQRYHEELKREMEIERERRNLTEKRKRLALSDDGELVNYVGAGEGVDEYEDEDELPAKRGRSSYE